MLLVELNYVPKHIGFPQYPPLSHYVCLHSFVRCDWISKMCSEQYEYKHMTLANFWMFFCEKTCSVLNTNMGEVEDWWEKGGIFFIFSVAKYDRTLFQIFREIIRKTDRLPHFMSFCWADKWCDLTETAA